MSTKTTNPGTLYRAIHPGKTHRATAEAIYDYLGDHPEELPGEDGARELAFQLSHRRADCVTIFRVNDHLLSVWPAAACGIQVERGWAANYGYPYGDGQVIADPHSERAGNTQETVQLIRLVVGRTVRYHRREAERVAGRR